MTDKVVMAVDVGTGSARAGAVRRAVAGCSAAREHPILMQPARGRTTPSRRREDIWQAVGAAPRGTRASRPGSPPPAVAGISFDATCSLVAARPRRTGRSASRPAARTAWNVDRLARPPRGRRGRGMHRHRPPGAGLSSAARCRPRWRSQADVAEAASAGAAGRALRPAARSRGLPDLAGQRHRRRARNARSTCKWTYLAHETAGLAAPTSSPEVGLDDLLRRGGLPDARDADRHRRSAPSARRPRPSSASTTRLPGRRRPDRCPCRGARGAGRRAGDGDGRRGARPPHRDDRRHLDLPHGAVAPSRARCRACGGPISAPCCRACGSTRAASRRPGRCSTTSSAARRRRRAAAARPTRRSSRGSPSCGAAEGAAFAARACTCCRTSTATARRSPTRMRSA